MSNLLSIKPSAHQGIKVIEMAHNILLSNNCYRKDDLTPISMAGANVDISTANNMLATKTHMNLNTGLRAGFRHRYFDIIKDPYIENRYYILLGGNHSDIITTESYIIVANDDDTGNDINFIDIYSYANMEFEEILDITDKYIFVSAKSTQYTGTCYVFRINKKTKEFLVSCSWVSNNNSYIANFKKINKNETYLYVIARYLGSSWYIHEIDKENNTSRSKLSVATNRTYVNTSGAAVGLGENSIVFRGQSIVNEDFYYENGKYYTIQPFANGLGFGGEGNANDNFVAFCYDTTIPFDDASCFVTKRITVNKNKELNWGYYNDYSARFRFWIIDNYLYYGVYDESNTAIGNFSKIQGIHVFKILPGFDLEWQSVNRISTTKPIISMIFSQDKKIALIGYWQSFEILRLNSETKEYESTNKIISGIISVGFDSFDRLWYMKTDNNIHVENLSDPYTVDMRFEHNYYTYEGIDIQSYITFQAWSFLGTYANGKYILTLNGNAKFKDTNTKIFEFIYSEGVTKIDIVVYGPDQIVCDTEFIKVW